MCGVYDVGVCAVRCVCGAVRVHACASLLRVVSVCSLSGMCVWAWMLLWFSLCVLCVFALGVISLCYLVVLSLWCYICALLCVLCLRFLFVIYMCVLSVCSLVVFSVCYRREFCVFSVCSCRVLSGVVSVCSLCALCLIVVLSLCSPRVLCVLVVCVLFLSVWYIVECVPSLSLWTLVVCVLSVLSRCSIWDKSVLFHGAWGYNNLVQRVVVSVHYVCERAFVL